MENPDQSVDPTPPGHVPPFAGFWRRVIAFLIDVVLVVACVRLAFILLSFAAPGVGKYVELRAPFGLGTIERTLEEKRTEQKDANGNAVTNTERVTEREVLGRWVYRYRVEDTRTEYGPESFISSTRYSVSWQVDPATNEPIASTDVDHIALVVLLLYWIWADASRAQASLGKRALSLKVVDADGERLTLAAASARNLLKVVSVLTLLIGFMMAGWTRRKQALHDWLADAYVVRRG